MFYRQVFIFTNCNAYDKTINKAYNEVDLDSWLGLDWINF